MAYLSLFATSFLAATLIPLPSELHLVLLVRTTGEVVLPLGIATAGNYLGACTTYALARGFLANRFRTSADAHPRVAAFFERYGAAALLLSWLPIVGDAFVALAGAVPVRFALFSLLVVLGKCLRYVVVVWVAL
jgi:membrane protein YqaA with SNARE-associated domain